MATSLEIKVSIERHFAKRGITPQRLIEKARTYDNYPLSRVDKFNLGMWSYVSGDLETEEEYKQAIRNGATLIIVELKVGERGCFYMQCCNEFGGKDCDPLTDRIELSLYEHNVWKCPRCDTVYAIRNMAASEEGDEL